MNPLHVPTFQYNRGSMNYIPLPQVINMSATRGFLFTRLLAGK